MFCVNSRKTLAGDSVIFHCCQLLIRKDGIRANLAASASDGHRLILVAWFHGGTLINRYLTVPLFLMLSGLLWQGKRVATEFLSQLADRSPVEYANNRSITL